MVKAIINNYTENTYIINEQKEAYIIDPGAHAQEIDEYIKEKELRVKGILLTHGHFDHLYSINEVQALYNCPIYIYKDERDFLFDPNLNLSSSISKPIRVMSKQSVQLFEDAQTLQIGREHIKIMHLPGHTRGSVGFVYKRYLFSGDTLFKGTIGRTDLPTSSKVAMDKSLKRIIRECKDNVVVYPGHGHFTTILTEKYENFYLKHLV